MCGICGKLYFDRSRSAEPEILEAMCAAIKHRGPDDTGRYMQGPVGLGSVRLSIIDVAGGHMPLSNEDGTVWIAYNGELYNFQKLRSRLEAAGHKFRTRSDTETIVHLYEEEGEDFTRHLNGMFAFAIWDDRKKLLLLARDPVGIKPLLYAQLPDRLLFASELKSILCDGVDRRVDRVALHDYLTLNYVPGPRTILEGIHKLQPGHMLIASLRDGNVRIRPYWEFPRPEETQVLDRPLPELEEELLDVLRLVVRDTMVSDVPIGAFLSGGLDSSLIVALMSEISEQPVHTFSVGFEERSYNELPYAGIVAERYQTDHHVLTLEPRAEDLVYAMADFFCEPFADNSALATFAVSKLAAEHVKVVLSGDGGDEVFGGYSTYQADRLAAIYRRLPSFIGVDLIPKMVRSLPTSFAKGSFDFRLKRFVGGAALDPLPAHFAWKAYLDETTKMRLYNRESLNGDLESLRPTVCLFQECYHEYATSDVLNRLIYVDNRIQLVDDMLTKVDRMSMAHSLEVRVPLLDRRVVSFMARLPSYLKVRGFTLKFLAKKMAERVLPREILSRRKGGFSIPVADWISTDLRALVEAHLSRRALEDQGLFDPEQVQALLDAHWQKKQDYSRSIWTLLMFSLWSERYLKTAGSLPLEYQEVQGEPRFVREVEQVQRI
jgi:asparagine synthase (glutamine-hydrolysing)